MESGVGQTPTAYLQCHYSRREEEKKVFFKEDAIFGKTCNAPGISVAFMVLLWYVKFETV